VNFEHLSNGVWPLIAEQLTRFVVAGRSDQTLRQVRDKLFEAILASGAEHSVAESLGTDSTRLFQKLELFIESVPPSLAIFIDDTNQDLNDFCNALDVPTEIYRVKKFIVNGGTEYYSPDKSSPVVVTEPEEAGGPSSGVFDAVEELGGGELLNSRLKVYKLSDGSVVKVQYSKLHEKHQAYWYGIKPSSYEAAKAEGCTHFLFVMGIDGFGKGPILKVEAYLESAYTTKNADGSVRHYHIHIAPPPDIVLKGYSNTDDIDLSSEFHSWS